MKTICFLLLSLILIGKVEIIAQVRIGSGNGKPQEFSILELSDNSSKGGLRMPHLNTTEERDRLTETTAFQNEKTGKALGLIIFNLETKCIEYWNGEKWISRCNDNKCPLQEMPGIITFSKQGPLKLNETFTASVPAEQDVSYSWSIPPTLAFVSQPTVNPVEIKAITPGIHGLYNIGVVATNKCGNKSSSRAGIGFIETLNCSEAPKASEFDITKIVTNLTKGSGTSADPYEVIEGYTFTLTYTDNPNVFYNWSLSSEGNQFFNIVTQGNGTITLRASASKVGETCDFDAIGMIASNDCGDSGNIASLLSIKIMPEAVPCPKPDMPGTITFSKNELLVGEILTISVPPSVDPGTIYSWKLPDSFVIVGSGTGNEITVRAAKVANPKLSQFSVAVTNDCGNTSDSRYGPSGSINAKDPSVVLTGNGNIIGKTCFDIASGNDNQYFCGSVNNRKTHKTDFTIRNSQDPAAGAVQPLYSGVQVYTFKPLDPSKVSNIRFAVVENPERFAVQRIEQNTQNDKKLTIYFNESLNTTLMGMTRDVPHYVYLYVVYTDTDTGEDRSLKATLRLQDCACCGAATQSGGWLNFMCHNLGAEADKDPFSYSRGIIGHTYQWGRQTDGHQERFSPEINRNNGTPVASNDDLNENGQVKGSKKGYFLNSWNVKVNGIVISDWRYPANDNLWRNDMRTMSDPCPPGWKVPSTAQWRSVINASANQTRVITETVYGQKHAKGLKIGDALFLPSSFTRMMYSYNPGDDATDGGEYWTSTAVPTDPTYSRAAEALIFRSNGNYSVGASDPPITYRAQGRSIRCVEEGATQ